MSQIDKEKVKKRQYGAQCIKEQSRYHGKYHTPGNIVKLRVRASTHRNHLLEIILTDIELKLDLLQDNTPFSTRRLATP